MNGLDDLEQRLLAGMHEHISEVLASSDDELTSQFELVSNKYSLEVFHPFGSSRLEIVLVNRDINIYVVRAGTGKWGGITTIMRGTLYNTMGNPQISVYHSEYAPLRGIYRLVLKAIDQDLGGALQEEVNTYLNTMREEISICEEMWGIQKVTQS